MIRPYTHVDCPLLRFLEDKGYEEVPGEYVAFAELRDEFLASLLPCERSAWTNATIVAELPPGCPVGRGPRNIKIIGNLSRKRKRPRRWIKIGSKLRLED